jgi:hypothetical protein
MNNIEKKLDALIDALGFDVEELQVEVPILRMSTDEKSTAYTTNYKLTKREPVKQPLDADSFGDKSGDIVSIPPRAFAEAAKKDLARGVDIRSSKSSYYSLLRVQEGINK